ncbi:MAG TPA: acyltransferase [Rhodopseudomonas sp.]|uniref:acyltransferase family protein n=1 Tax=Rhodopseudomonas sp. TaxID=1078 RepID=UPI002ED83E4C
MAENGAETLRTFQPLDGLRGAAALAVATLHGSQMFGQGVYFRHGYLAVDLFFVLSGVVIGHAYGGRLKAGMSVGEFARIRLYPLYVLGLSVMGVWAAYAISNAIPFTMFRRANWAWTDLLSTALWSAAFLPSFSGDWHARIAYPLNPVSWSLFFELLINLLYAGFRRYITRIVLVIVIALSAGWLIHVGLTYNSLDRGFELDHWDGAIPRTCFSFSVGLLIYDLVVAGAPRVAVPPALLIAVTVAILYVNPLSGVFDLVCVMLIFPALVYCGTRHLRPGASASLYGFCGRISYAVYTLHFPLVVIIMINFGGVRTLPVGVALGLGIAGLVLLCWIVDRLYDTPLRSLLRRLSDRPARAALAAAECAPKQTA